MERAFCNAGVDARCLTVDVAPERLESAIEGMRAMGFRGGVIASPHNEAVCSLLDELTPVAQFVGRADSIFRSDDGRFVGDHTLGVAVAAAAGVDWAGKHVIVCGTGPEAGSIARILAEEPLDRLVVASAAATDGEALVQRLTGISSIAIEFERTSHNVDFEPEADVVIRAEPIDALPGHQPDPPPLVGEMRPGTVAVDLPYRAPGTDFLNAAQAKGCRIVDGVDVLVCRANKAFHRWTGNEADIAALRDAVEEFFMI